MSRYTPEIPTCRFLDPELGGRFPYVDFDTEDPLLPCNALLEIGDFGKGAVLECAIAPIPVKGCMEQRRAGLCPRNLGLIIPPELKP